MSRLTWLFARTSDLAPAACQATRRSPPMSASWNGRVRNSAIHVRGIDAASLRLRLAVGCDKADLSRSRRGTAILLLGRRVAHDKRWIIRDHDPLDTCTRSRAIEIIVFYGPGRVIG